jgi:acyl carrier protein
MPDSTAVLQTIFRAIDITNEVADPAKQLVKAPETPLYGRDSVLDSLQFVSFVVTVEREMEDAFGVQIVLVSDRAMSQRHSPFRTVGTLAEYILQLLTEGAGAP